MIPDWLTNILPIINAGGIPILAIGIILLFRAYQKATETYRDTSNHLKDENDRLRKRLAESDANYFSEIDKIRVTVSSSLDAIKELQARKAELFSQSDFSVNQEILTEVRKIDNVIEILQKISSSITEIEVLYQSKLNSLTNKFEELFIRIGEMSTQIDDSKSRNAIRGVILSYYKILQVDQDAEIEVIEAAYRRLALKYHPDTNQSPDAAEKMKMLNEARDAVVHNLRKRRE
jgi:DnaJ-domain-containing protein 1